MSGDRPDVTNGRPPVPEMGTAADRVSLRNHKDAKRTVEAVRVLRAGEPPLVLPLEGSSTSTILLGRGDQMDVRFRDDHVSRVHGMLRRDGTQWVYVDLGAANGSAVQAGEFSADVKPGIGFLLSVGDVVRLGRRLENSIEVLGEVPASEVNAKTVSPAGRVFEAQLQSVSKSSLPVFLLGASGSGKTWAARWIHAHSGKAGAFISVNCARLPTEASQLHSELLGHKKGAFTGADRDRVGAFVAADGGTLFLDEVESLPMVAQGFLLDLLEGTHPLLPLGASSTSTTARPKVRVLSASKVQLKRSALRADLTHRLTVGEILIVPRLAERRADIPGLVEQFASAFAARENVAVPKFTLGAMRALSAAPWQGEVRELEASVETLVDRAARSKRIVVDVDAVQERIAVLRAGHGTDDDEEEETRPHLKKAATLIDSGALAATAKAFAEEAKPLRLNPRAATKADIEAALVVCAHNIDKTAAYLGWARNTLTSRMDEFGIPRPSRSRAP